MSFKKYTNLFFLEYELMNQFNYYIYFFDSVNVLYTLRIITWLLRDTLK